MTLFSVLAVICVSIPRAASQLVAAEAQALMAVVDALGCPASTCPRVGALVCGNVRFSGRVVCNGSSVTRFAWDSGPFNGTLPSDIGALTALTELTLTRHAVASNIPTQIGRLTRLTRLDLSIGQLRGTVPPAIGTLTSLVHLGLNGNNLVGQLPDLSRTKLHSLLVNGNQFTGTLPALPASLTVRLFAEVNGLVGAGPSRNFSDGCILEQTCLACVPSSNCNCNNPLSAAQCRALADAKPKAEPSANVDTEPDVDLNVDNASVADNSIIDIIEFFDLVGNAHALTDHFDGWPFCHVCKHRWQQHGRHRRRRWRLGWLRLLLGAFIFFVCRARTSRQQVSAAAPKSQAYGSVNLDTQSTRYEDVPSVRQVTSSIVYGDTNEVRPSQYGDLELASSPIFCRLSGSATVSIRTLPKQLDVGADTAHVQPP